MDRDRDIGRRENRFENLPKPEITELYRLINGSGIEVFPSEANFEKIRARLPERLVDITSSPTLGIGETLKFAFETQALGVDVLLHVAARNIEDQQFEPLFAEIANAGLRKLLIVGGDNEKPKGRWRSAIELLEDMIVFGYKPDEIEVAGYPRTHNKVKKMAARDAFLFEKYNFAIKHGIRLGIKTQLTSLPKYIGSYLNHLEKIGIDAPVTVELLGPTPLLKAHKHLKEVGVNDIGLILERIKTGNIVEDAKLLRFDPISYLEELVKVAKSESLRGICFNTMGDYNRTLDLVLDSEKLLQAAF